MDFILGCVREEIQSKIVPLFDVPPNSGNDIDGPVIDQGIDSKRFFKCNDILYKLFDSNNLNS